jgi:hypothetical protein
MGFDWERRDFRRGHSPHNDKVGRAPRAGLAKYRHGVLGGRLMELGFRAAEWSALPYGNTPALRAPRNGTAPLQREKGSHKPPKGGYTAHTRALLFGAWDLGMLRSGAEELIKVRLGLNTCDIAISP